MHDRRQAANGNKCMPRANPPGVGRENPKPIGGEEQTGWRVLVESARRLAPLDAIATGTICRAPGKNYS